MSQQNFDRRKGVTLTEIITVVAIVFVLLTLVLGAIMYTATSQMRRQTEQTMLKALAKLDSWIEKVRAQVDHPVGDWYKAVISAVEPYQGDDVLRSQRRKVLEFKYLYKYRMPISYQELYDAANGLRDPEMQVLDTRRQSEPGLNNPLDQSSVCVALILWRVSRPDEFDEKQLRFKDPSNEGRVGLLDAWGNPMAFYRYGYIAPPSLQPLIQQAAAEQFANIPGKDPLDRHGLLNNDWWSRYGGWHQTHFGYPQPSNGPPNYYAPLVLVSRGRDGQLGTSDDIISYRLVSSAGGQ